MRRAPVFAIVIARGRVPAEIDLGFIVGKAFQHIEAFRFSDLQPADEALDRVVLVSKSVPLDQVLVNALRVAAEFHSLLNLVAVFLAGRTGFPGGRAGGRGGF